MSSSTITTRNLPTPMGKTRFVGFPSLTGEAPAVSDAVTLGAPADVEDLPMMPRSRKASTHPSSGALGQIANFCGMRGLALVGVAALALGLTGCGDKTPAPTPDTSHPQTTQSTVSAGSLTERLQQLKGDKGYATMAEAGFYRQILDGIVKDTAAAQDVASKQIAQEAVKAFDHKGTPESQQQAMATALKSIQEQPNGSYHEAAAAALSMGSSLKQGLATPPSGLMVQIKAGAYEKALEEAIKQLPSLPQTLSSHGVSPALVSGYVSQLSLESKAALDYSRQIKDPGLSVVLFEGTANQLYGQVQSNAELLNTQFGAALSLLKNLKL